MKPIKKKMTALRLALVLAHCLASTLYARILPIAYHPSSPMPAQYTAGLDAFSAKAHAGAQTPQPTRTGRVCFGNVFLSRQSDVDGFDCQAITGTLTISGRDIVDLAPLRMLQRVAGLTIRNTNLVSLEGLDGLSGELPFLRVSDCPRLVSIAAVTRHLARLADCNLFALPALENLAGLGGSGLVNLRVRQTGIVSMEGLEGLDTLLRGLAIEENPNLARLDGLGDLAFVGGLRVFRNNALASLRALGRLRNANELDIGFNESLLSLKGLGRLQRASAVAVYNNPKLASLVGLRGLASVGRLEIRENGRLQSLVGLDGLRGRVGLVSIFGNGRLVSLSRIGDVSRIDNLFITANPKLRYLYGLGESALQNIGMLRIDRNQGLLSLQGLGRMRQIGTLEITNNPSLASLRGLENLRKADRVRLLANPLVSTLAPLASLQGSVDDLEIAGLDQLENLVGLGGVAHIGHLRLRFNQAMRNLAGLEGVATAGTLDISRSEKLASLQGLANLDSVGGELDLSSLPITSLQGLDGVTYVRALRIRRNPQLASLAGLGSLERAFSVLVDSNGMLPNLEGLGALARADRLSVNQNARLSSLAGLVGLQQLGSLTIFANPQLGSLAGLDSLVFTDNAFILLSDNPRLSACCAVDTWRFASPPRSFLLRRNAFGCNSQKEIDAACAVSQGPVGLVAAFSENPMAQATTLSLATDTPYRHAQAVVADLMGNALATVPFVDGQARLARGQWPAGAYLCRVVVDGRPAAALRLLVR